MRAWSAPVALSSIVLAGWLTGAKAQDVGYGMQSILNPAPDLQSGNADELGPGVIPQPGIQNPGVVVGITLGELYTDNLDLAPPGNPKETSWITQVEPFLKSAYSGSRFAGVFNYKLSGYLYPGKSSYNQLAQDLHATGTLTVLPQHFFLDATASYGQAIVDNQRPSGSGTFFLSNNQTNIGIGTLSPYWMQDVGNVGTMKLRYTVGRVMYGDQGIPAQGENLLSGIPDATSNTVQFSLVSPKYETWGWDMGYSEQRINPDSGNDMDFAMARLGVSRQVSLNTQLLANVGKETKFLPDGTTDKLGASYWNAGVDYSNTRDSLHLLVGHRFYGPSYNLSWTHVAALLTTSLSYVEQPTTYNQQLFGTNPGSGEPPPINVAPPIPSLTEYKPYLSKRWQASATYLMPRGSLRLSVYDEQRTYFDQDNSQEKVANASIDWRYEIGPFTTLTPTFGWQRYQYQDGQISHTTFTQLAFVHQFNVDDFASVKLRHESRDVSFAIPGADGYRANVIFLQWTHLF